MFYGFLTVSVICLTVLAIIKIALRHAENMKRISHGYPTLESAGRSRADDSASYGEPSRLQ